MWRPEDWTNPCTDSKEDVGERGYITSYHRIFEEGADAMLKALKEQTSCPQEVYDSEGKKLGILVFILSEDL